MSGSQAVPARVRNHDAIRSVQEGLGRGIVVAQLPSHCRRLDESGGPDWTFAKVLLACLMRVLYLSGVWLSQSIRVQSVN